MGAISYVDISYIDISYLNLSFKAVLFLLLKTVTNMLFYNFQCFFLYVTSFMVFLYYDLL